MRKSRLAAGISLALFTVTAVEAPTTRGLTGAAGSPVLDEGRFQDESEAMAADLEAMRVARGWTADQLAAYERHESALDVLSDRLAKEHEGALVGSALAKDPTEQPTLYVKGPATADLLREADDLGVQIIDEQPYSMKDLDHRLATLQASLAETGVTDVVGWADIRNEGAITVALRLDGDSGVEKVRAAATAALAGDINLIVSTDSVIEDQGTFGGMKLQDGGVFECTSGWTVRKLSNGVRGVSGAGHCAGIDQINHPGHGVHAAAVQADHVGEWGDVEWYTTGEAEADDFYIDQFNNIRDVTGVEPRGNIAVGEGICFFGRSSNQRDCSLSVENPNVFCGIGPQKLVQMDGDVTDGGDSGGGWSFGNTAFGGHKGNCFSKSSFSVADLFDEALGVVVAVN